MLFAMTVAYCFIPVSLHSKAAATRCDLLGCGPFIGGPAFRPRHALVFAPHALAERLAPILWFCLGFLLFFFLHDLWFRARLWYVDLRLLFDNFRFLLRLLRRDARNRDVADRRHYRSEIGRSAGATHFFSNSF